MNDVKSLCVGKTIRVGGWKPRFQSFDVNVYGFRQEKVFLRDLDHSASEAFQEITA